eukprot:Hpha_TRINITY_DN16442_c1_g2::TRINITY_DN16442_c1_g2_i1::g.159627::m.159627
MRAVSCCLSMLVVGAVAQTPPTLPTMWTAETVDPPMGDGIESYNFVDDPTEHNPSTMWSNYTGCQRLIWVGNNYDAVRYLLKCDAVDCCTEDQGGNQVEFQIPNVHPAYLTKVKYGGREKITNFGDKVEADAWSWKFAMEEYTAYTNSCADCVNNVTLLQWVVNTAYVNATIQFRNFRGIGEAGAAAFKSSFAIPPQCQGSQVMSCTDARSRGLLRKGRMFLW